MKKGTYDDIIHLPAHQSKKHPPMSLSNRAAQFAPFSALVGHKDVIKEAARITGEKIELEEDAITVLNEKLTVIQREHLKGSEVIITYFAPDEKKSGGAYRSKKGVIKKVDQVEGNMVMKDGTYIPLEDIFGIETKDSRIMKDIKESS